MLDQSPAPCAFCVAETPAVPELARKSWLGRWERRIAERARARLWPSASSPPSRP